MSDRTSAKVRIPMLYAYVYGLGDVDDKRDSDAEKGVFMTPAITTKITDTICSGDNWSPKN